MKKSIYLVWYDNNDAYHRIINLCKVFCREQDALLYTEQLNAANEEEDSSFECGKYYYTQEDVQESL